MLEGELPLDGSRFAGQLGTSDNPDLSSFQYRVRRGSGCDALIRPKDLKKLRIVVVIGSKT